MVFYSLGSRFELFPSRMESLHMRTLREIRKKISQLQMEKIELLVELENLKARAQKNVACLENEVQQLRDQVNEFTQLLDSV